MEEPPLIEIAYRGRDWAPEWVGRDMRLESKGYSLRLATSAGIAWQADVKAPLWHRVCSRSTHLRRLLRLGIHGAELLSSGDAVVLIMGQFVRVSSDGTEQRVLHDLQAGRRPLDSGWLVDSRNRIVYGEYSSNSTKSAVRVWRSDDTHLNWTSIASIPAGTARHVHCVFELGDGSLMVATGDEDYESAVWLLDPTGKLERVEGGDQNWRTVSIQEDDGEFLFGTDSPYSQNSIVKSPLDGSGRRSFEVQVDGPIYYSALTSIGVVFASTVERGSGEHDDWITLWWMSENGWAPLRIARKDRLSNRFFGHGVLHFARGDIRSLPSIPVTVDAVEVPER